MYRKLIGSLFLAIGFLVLPSLAVGQKKDADNKKDADKKDADSKKEGDKKKDGDKDKSLVAAGALTGTIESIEESSRALRLNIGKKTINPVAHDALNLAVKARSKAKTAQEKYAADLQIVSAQKDLYTSVLELQTTADVIVRVIQPPPQFDDKGRVKKYTQKELRELRGNPKLPGYTSDFANLRQKQIVKVTLVKKKETVKARAAKGKDADTGLLGENLPMVNMVIVLQDVAN